MSGSQHLAHLLDGVRQAGRRYLTYCFTGDPGSPPFLTNCAATASPASGFVVGGCNGSGEPPFILPGPAWYSITSNANMFVQQMRPDDLREPPLVDPVNCGEFVPAGDKLTIYVSRQCIDGGLAIAACFPPNFAICGYEQCAAVAFVNRISDIIDVREDTMEREVKPSNVALCDP